MLDFVKNILIEQEKMLIPTKRNDDPSSTKYDLKYNPKIKDYSKCPLTKGKTYIRYRINAGNPTDYFIFKINKEFTDWCLIPAVNIKKEELSKTVDPSTLDKIFFKTKFCGENILCPETIKDAKGTTLLINPYAVYDMDQLFNAVKNGLAKAAKK